MVKKSEPMWPAPNVEPLLLLVSARRSMRERVDARTWVVKLYEAGFESTQTRRTSLGSQHECMLDKTASPALSIKIFRHRA